LVVEVVQLVLNLHILDCLVVVQMVQLDIDREGMLYNCRIDCPSRLVAVVEYLGHQIVDLLLVD